jgi:hypothetical protein
LNEPLHQLHVSQCVNHFTRGARGWSKALFGVLEHPHKNKKTVPAANSCKRRVAVNLGIIICKPCESF